MADAFYVAEPDGTFVATPFTRGPWSERHQHAGPPTALLARAMELAVPGFQASRLTMELLKPIPIGRVEVRVQDAGGGASVRRVSGSLSVDGVEVVRGLGLFLSKSIAPPEGIPEVAPPTVERRVPDAGHGVFDFFRWDVGYHTAVDLRYEVGSLGQPAVVAWIRAKIELVAGEAPSGVQRVMIAADSGNGVTAAIDFRKYDFLNADLTVHLGRAPVGEWIALDAEMRADRSGSGLVFTRLHDERGMLGIGAQSLVVRPSRR
ncbi:MAG: thioesterase family protein [Polyangiales bacterium]